MNEIKNDTTHSPNNPNQSSLEHSGVYKRNKSSKPIIAGSLLIIIGIIGVIFSSLVIGGGLVMDAIEDIPFQGFTVTSIEGTIRDSSGDPVENVSITIVGSHLGTMTNSTGRYQIYGIPSDYHKIKIEKEGYNTLIYNTYIVTGDDFQGFMTEEEHKNSPLNINNDQYDFQISQGSETFEYGSTTAPHTQFFQKFGGWISGFGIITLFCSILSIIGGYFAVNRQKHILVLLCSIAAIFSFGFFIGTLLAIIALIIIIISSNEFNGAEIHKIN